MFYIKNFVMLILFTGLVACGGSDNQISSHQPVGFTSSDECHVCGMVITRLKGPKGQAFETRSKQMKKFCSTTELIFWYLQPENTPNVTDIYVHDMAQSEWDTPNDKHLIPARDAVFVINSDKQGAMGKTLASFLRAKDAAQFANQYGGEVIAFNGLTLALLSQ